MKICYSRVLPKPHGLFFTDLVVLNLELIRFYDYVCSIRQKIGKEYISQLILAIGSFNTKEVSIITAAISFYV